MKIIEITDKTPIPYRCLIGLINSIRTQEQYLDKDVRVEYSEPFTLKLMFGSKIIFEKTLDTTEEDFFKNLPEGYKESSIKHYGSAKDVIIMNLQMLFGHQALIKIFNSAIKDPEFLN